MREGLIRWDTGTSGELPSDWKEQAARRLGFVAATAIGVALVSLALSFLRQENVGARAGSERPAWVIALGLVASVAMLVAARSTRLRAQLRLDLGLAYAVTMSFLGSVFRHALPYEPTDVLRGVSAVVPALLFFAILVPVPPRRMAVAATLAALTDPFALWLSVRAGAPSPPLNLWLWLFAPDAVAVLLAVVTSRLVNTLGKAVKRASELGSYRLHEKLGAGGMGEVWRAEHRMLARPAAIKVMGPAAFGKDDQSVARARARFEREAQATAMLTSPHTIEVYDFGVAQDGSFFYVMELLEGMDLSTLLVKAGPLPPARAMHMLLQVCHSLRDAHQAGVIHRDIKPANLFVCRRGSDLDFVKVLDFGLVKSFARDEAAPVTIAGSATGTPGYMAPEAIRGLEQDPRSDIYAIGCVAYRMLTGRDVFQMEEWIPMLSAHLEKEPTPVDQVAGQPIPAALSRWVMRCLEKSPDARHGSVAAMMSELEALAKEHPWTPDLAAACWSNTPAAPGRALQPLGEADTLAV